MPNTGFEEIQELIEVALLGISIAHASDLLLFEDCSVRKVHTLDLVGK